MTVEQSVPSYPNAPAVYDRVCLLEESQLSQAHSNEALILTAKPQKDDESGEFETNGRLMLQAAGNWAKETSEGVIIPQ